MHLLKAMGLKGDESFEEIEAKLDAGDVDVARLLNKRSEKDKQQRKDCCQKAAQAPFPPFLGPHYGWVRALPCRLNPPCC